MRREVSVQLRGIQMLIKGFFAVKMMIKCAFCQLRRFADVIDRHGLIAVFMKKTGCGIEQFVAAEDALAQAGADIEALKAVQEKDETAGETAERHVQALVIGAGGSGLAAAITLQEQGIETLVVDKMANAGGCNCADRRAD